MYLVYSAAAIAEVVILLGSAIGLAFLIVRAIVRAVFTAQDDSPKAAPQDTAHLKRADSRPSG